MNTDGLIAALSELEPVQLSALAMLRSGELQPPPGGWFPDAGNAVLLSLMTELIEYHRQCVDFGTMLATATPIAIDDLDQTEFGL